MRLKPGMILKVSAAILSMFFLAGCADKVQPPTQQISMATQAIAQAETAGAFELAPMELKAARDKLSLAQRAMEKEDNLKAGQLADQAMIDANLAEAKARSAKAQKTVEELKENIRILREEMDRKAGTLK